MERTEKCVLRTREITRILHDLLCFQRNILLFTVK